MPVITDKRMSFFKLRTIWFENKPYDVDGVDSITHMYCKENVDAHGFNRETLSTLMIDLTKGLDQVWSDMDGDCRKWIRRSEKEGFAVHMNKDYESFTQMNNEFRKSKGLPPYSHTDEFLKKDGTLFTAELNGQLLCGYLAIHDDVYMRGLQAVSKRLDADDNVRKMISFGNRMLVWEAIKYAHSIGIKQYDLGGYYVGETPNAEMEGINRFKRGFGGQLVERSSYVKDYSFSLRVARKMADGWNKLRGY